MAEKVVIGNAELWHGDCREVLPLLAPGAGIVSDPPYGIGYSLGAGGKGIGNGTYASRLSNMPIEGDDSPFEPAMLVALGVPMILWGGNHFASRLSVRLRGWCGTSEQQAATATTLQTARLPGQTSRGWRACFGTTGTA